MMTGKNVIQWLRKLAMLVALEMMKLIWLTSPVYVINETRMNVRVMTIHLKLFRYRGMSHDGFNWARNGRADWADGNDASSGSAFGALLILEDERCDIEDEAITDHLGHVDGSAIIIFDNRIWNIMRSSWSMMIILAPSSPFLKSPHDTVVVYHDSRLQIIHHEPTIHRRSLAFNQYATANHSTSCPWKQPHVVQQEALHQLPLPSNLCTSFYAGDELIRNKMLYINPIP